MLLKTLLLGGHTNHDYGSHYGIDPLTSSVTLLIGSDFKVLFDTGSLAYQKDLLEGLASCNVDPDEITHICLTHYHLDHTANCILFKYAEVHTARSFVDHKTGGAFVYRNMQEKPLPQGIRVEETPGHTSDHVSYFFEVDGIRYCIGGDAVREDIIREGIPSYFDKDRASDFVRSLKMIFAESDVIIPGHFRIIEGELKDELGEMVEGMEG